MLLPLFFVIVVAMLKDAFEDYARYKEDMKENNSICRRFSTHHNEFRETTWGLVKVGDRVKV